MGTLTTLLSVILASASASTPGDRPPSPYIDSPACPFEGCIYREWHTTRAVALYDRPDGQKIAKLNKGEWVMAFTGETHSIPLEIVASREIPEAGIHAGDTFYVLHYEGEFYWLIWFKGKTFDAESGDPRSPEATWWARVKRKNGSIGWVEAGDGAFGNQDLYGTPG